MLHQVDGSERFGGVHVWPCPLDGLEGKPSLVNVILASCLGVLEGLPDDVLKVRVHAGYESAAGGKRKARRRGAKYAC